MRAIFDLFPQRPTHSLACRNDVICSCPVSCGSLLGYFIKRDVFFARVLWAKFRLDASVQKQLSLPCSLAPSTLRGCHRRAMAGRGKNATLPAWMTGGAVAGASATPSSQSAPAPSNTSSSFLPVSFQNQSGGGGSGYAKPPAPAPAPTPAPATAG